MAETQTQANAGLTDEVRAALEAQAAGLAPEATKLAADQAAEYGEFVATQAIDFGGVRAYNIGDAVPKSNVEKYKYDDLGWVAKRTTKAGKAAIAEATGVEEVK